MAKVKTFRFNNLTGGINTTAEENALVSFDTNGSGVQAEARDIENFMPLNRGGQTKTKGFTLHKAVGANPITGLYRYIKANGDSYFLTTSGTDLYKLVSGTLTSLYSSVTSNAYTHFETAYDKCILCDGTHVPQTFDGTSVAALSSGGDATAITGSKASLFYQNRLFLFGNPSNPSILYYSRGGDITLDYSINFVNCDVNDGQKITGIAKFFIPGSLEAILVVGKESSVGIITGSGTLDDPYTFSKINQDAGIPGFRQFVQFGQDIAYLTPKGVSSYKTDNQNVNLIYNFLSEKVRDRFQALDPTYLMDAHCWYDWKKTRISFAVPELNSQYPNVIWHFDIRLGCWYKERHGTGTITASLVDTDGTWYHGDSSGNIYIHGDTYNSFNGAAINAFYKTPYLDFGAPHLRKRIIDSKITVRGNGTYSMGIASSLDYGIRLGKTNTINLNAGSYTWGGGLWTSDPDVYQWGGNPILRRRYFPSGLFDNFQQTFSQSGIDEPIDIFDIEYTVEFEDFR